MFSKQSSDARICVIGAGVSGLVVVKELKEKGFTNITCYEKAPKFGGVFYHNPENHVTGSVYDSVKLTISNQLMAFSDFPPPTTSYVFWHHTQYYEYLESYVKHFEIGKYFHFGHSIEKLVRKGNVWVVSVNDGRGTVEHEYDAVAVGAGTHHIPVCPTWPGLDSFKGTVRHSTTYKNPSPYTGKKVLIVGAGESGSEITREISLVTKECYMASRIGFIIKKFPFNGTFPVDAYGTRMLLSMPDVVPKTVYRLLSFFGSRFHPDPVQRLIFKYGRESGGDGVSQFHTKNEAFLKSVVEGKLVIKRAITHFDESKVYFSDQSSAEIDEVLLCTGYQDTLPFMPGFDHGFDVRSDFFKHCLHPDTPNLIFMGYARPASGGVPATAEMQARLFAGLLAGEIVLPERAEFVKRIRADAEMERRTFCTTGTPRTIVSLGPYMDSMAALVGCLPHLRNYLTSPCFLLSLYTKCLLPAQYRLEGPGAKPEIARRTINGQPTPPNIIPLQFGIFLFFSFLAKLHIVTPNPASLPW